jgi:hypothetical protein
MLGSFCTVLTTRGSGVLSQERAITRPVGDNQRGRGSAGVLTPQQPPPHHLLDRACVFMSHAWMPLEKRDIVNVITSQNDSARDQACLKKKTLHVLLLLHAFLNLPRHSFCS